MIYTIFELFFIFILLISINFILKNKEVLIDKPEYSEHKLKINSGVPLSGGLFLIVMLFFKSFFSSIPSMLLALCFLIFILGIIADVKKNFSIHIRFFLQALILIIFIFSFDLKIPTLGNKFLDIILINQYINYIFIFFCLITLLNGFNFIDGVNGLTSGYFLLISLFIYFLNLNILHENIFIKDLNFLLLKLYFIFFILNILGKCFFGDNGIYVSLICISFILINIFKENFDIISPYLIASLLWYPAFENLFSILRRMRSNKKIIQADNLHLHYLLMKNINIIKYFKNKNKQIVNSTTGIIINILLMPGLIFSYYNYNNSKMLIFNILVYLILYFILYRYLLKKI